MVEVKEKKLGKVFLVGAGPGDIGLITQKALELISTCDVLVFDHLANSELRKRAIENCEQIDVGKSPGSHTMPQDEIGKILVKKANEGKKVVRLKGGDPFVFGRCAEEMIVLDQASIPYEIVPGVTAALACAAYAGIPLSHREYGSSISFLTGHEDVEKESLRVDFAKFAEVGGTLCIYMGMGTLKEITIKLLDGGLSPEKPAAIVSHGTLPAQRKVITTLGNLVKDAQRAKLEAPAIIFIGNSVGLSTERNWFEERPLFKKRIVVTRPVGQASRLKVLLEEKGAEVLELPLIKILPQEDRKLIAETFAGIATYEWVVFTSANGAREFFKLFFKAFGDIRSFGPMRVACVGEATAEVVRKFNLEVELMPKRATAEDLAQALVATDSLDSANVLVITGNRNREVFVGLLESVGRAIVDTLPIYQTDFADVLEAKDRSNFIEKGADAIVFASSSAALSYIEQEEDLKLSEGANSPIFCSFGTQTSETLLENELSVVIESEDSTLESMVESIVNHFKE
ncbi:MAG: uroporphyrinogen-III C-methyltransferase [Verrucomicrobiia bacterium]